MRTLRLLSIFIVALCTSLLTQPLNAAESLDVLKMTEIPPGSYDVQLQYEGTPATVKLNINGNRATFVESSLSKLEGMSGNFELLGNGVFLAFLRSKAGGATQIWVFKPDGTATIKEIPDRGEKQFAKLSSKD